LSQNDKPPIQPVNTRIEIARAAGVSTGQVGMAEQVKKKSPELWEKAKAGEISISSAYKTVNTHVGHNTGENEWYTPPQFIESARVVMGSIDLDPASSEIANRTVKAVKHYSKEDNGLDQQWHGNVWMNPPYAQPLMSQFAEAVASKHESGEIAQAIVLVNNATETQWWQRMASCSSAVCFPKTRIRFLDPDGNPGAPLQGQSILYFGESKTVFVEEFSKYGATYS
jgi:ParB family chromosome partitioning protein